MCLLSSPGASGTFLKHVITTSPIQEKWRPTRFHLSLTTASTPSTLDS